MSAPISVSPSQRRHTARFAVLTLSCGALLGLAGVPPALASEAPPALPPLPAAQAQATPALPIPRSSTASSGSTPISLPAPTTAAITSTRRILLELGRRTISLYDGDKVLGSWPVAIGDPATPTPTGSFKIRNKVVNPQYQSTKSGKNNPTVGPNGPLGDRWMGFHATNRDQFGIHGTPPAWAWAVNTRAAVSHGCVRMLNPHVHALFDQVEVGTPVIVKN
ncbi:MAG: L,D-transpeptidase [Synechococcaceae cyanobacterium ELA263]